MSNPKTIYRYSFENNKATCSQIDCELVETLEGLTIINLKTLNKVKCFSTNILVKINPQDNFSVYTFAEITIKDYLQLLKYYFKHMLDNVEADMKEVK